MNPLVQLSAWVRSVAAKFLRPTQTAGDIDEELLAHIQCRADDLERSGLSRTEAERRARIEFGGYQKFRVETHEAIGAQFLETFLADLRFALRVLRKSPGFTFAAIATLTLAIGANAVVFGLMDGLILRPLNVPHAENLYGTEYGIDAGLQSYPNYLDLRARNHSFEDLAAFKMVFTGMDTGGDPQSANGYAVTGNYFSVLRLQPFLGRFFDQSDERGPNSAPYIVLTHAYWHVRFHDNPGVIGRVVQLDKQPFTIIGVAPSGFHGTLMFVSPDYFMPIVNQAQVDGSDLLHDRGSIQAIFEAMGHLKPGVTPEQATADVNAIGAWLAKTYPKECGQKHFVLGRTGLTSFSTPAKEFIGGLMLLAGLILLAACANLGGLFAARAADRAREIALRLALGSNRRRIVRGLLTEPCSSRSPVALPDSWSASFCSVASRSGSPSAARRLPCPSTPDPRLSSSLSSSPSSAHSSSAWFPCARSSAPTRTKSSKPDRAPVQDAASPCATCCSSFRSPSAPCSSLPPLSPSAG